MNIKLIPESASTIMKSILLAALVTVIAACGSNKPKEEATNGPVEEPTAVASGIDEAEPVETTIDTSADLESVFYFDYDQSNLTSSARAALDAQAGAQRGGSSAIRLEGHADERGSREYNLALGERRAKAVADYLAIQGVSRARIEVVSYGEERPVSLRSDESAYSQNRRVELK